MGDRLKEAPDRGSLSRTATGWQLTSTAHLLTGAVGLRCAAGPQHWVKMEAWQTGSKTPPVPTCSSTQATRWTGGPGATQPSQRPGPAMFPSCFLWVIRLVIGAM